MDKGKWIVRAASLVVVLGFFMPSVLVSCSGGFMETSQSMNLAAIADKLNKPVLYLLLIAFLVTGVISFLRADSLSMEKNFLWIEAGAASLGLLTTLVTLISLNSQLKQGTYGLVSIKPTFGLFLILGGIAAFVVGWVQQWQAIGKPKPMFGQVQNVPDRYPAKEQYEQPQEVFQPQQLAYHPQQKMLQRGPLLRVLSGNLPVSTIQIDTDNFTIGRSSESMLQLPNKEVSRMHAKIRLAEGMCFIQDQESSGGTFVNGKQTNAIRLNDGDEITIGPYRFMYSSEEDMRT